MNRTEIAALFSGYDGVLGDAIRVACGRGYVLSTDYRAMDAISDAEDRIFAVHVLGNLNMMLLAERLCVRRL